MSNWPTISLRPHSIRARLIITYTLLFVVPFAVIGAVLLQALDHTYLSRLQADMAMEASLIAESAVKAVEQGGTVQMAPMLRQSLFAPQSEPRVLLFDINGHLVAGSDASFNSIIGRPLEEPGLRAAFSGLSMHGIELSQTAGAPIAYVAQPIVDNGKVVGAVQLSYELDDIQTAENQLRMLIIAAGFLVVLFAVLMSMWLARSITAPLLWLGVATADIANGNFGRRVTVDSPVELADLAHSFNQMAEALQKTRQDERTTFANITHDVRTPLGSLRAAIEALCAGAANQQEPRDRLLHGMMIQVRYLTRLTDDLLRLAAYEGGGLVLRLGAIALPELLAQAVQSFDAQAQSRQIRLSTSVPTSLPLVRADPDRVLETLFNLLDNAMTYTPPGGEIRITAEMSSERSCVWIHVIDNGPSILPESLPHVFERYYRGNRSRMGAREGASVNMGLGLSIVREIVKAHGGVIAVSIPPEGGVDFHFSLAIDPSGAA
ncbi:MAG: ATP-binding protein [Chloroflexi bacterium]|nr:ATP-binding protein [Chloroflexota bacterium]